MNSSLTGVRAIPLGLLSVVGGVPVLALQDREEDSPRLLQLEQVTVDFLASLRAGDTLSLTEKEQAVLQRMAAEGVVALVAEDVAPEELGVVPGLLEELTVVDELADGYRLAVGATGKFVEVPELGYRLLGLVDGVQSFGQLVAAMKAELAADEADEFQTELSPAQLSSDDYFRGLCFLLVDQLHVTAAGFFTTSK